MTTLLVTVLIFLIMISLHEFGHFLFGKLLGFNVLEYAIGFGPALFKKQGKKTLYSVRLIPFGGYCKFAGEDGENETSEGDFNEQPCWKRVIVLSAGAIFNILLGFILFIIFTFSYGSVRTNTINSVVEGSYLEQAGILEGDKIIELNGKNIDFFNDISLAMQDLKKDSDVNLVIKRGNEKISKTFKLSEQVSVITFYEDYAEQETIINGKPLPKIQQAYSDDFVKDESKIGKSIKNTSYILGIIGKSEDVTLLNVIPNSYYMTKFFVKLVYKTVWDMVTGNVGVSELSGPVGIVTVVNDAVKQENSLLNILNLTALLTINLGIFNLLPLPALDGGRIIFVLIEMIRRKPISPEKEGLVHSIGFLLLILLMIFVSYQDILRLF